ncbi:MAG: hypothetical protein COA52_01370 [Hyphomicrobiales bacterium]|nr:MAG: hypothetical protein COA52_00280 [Hyphomicrobiales bacterium]PCJ96882.1 MAG: hypothetical protein COA52_01370 [Hyphomicrobiales bacterium]
MKKILIIGAGFTGATIARTLAEAGYSVEIVDKRDHVAGNAYDYKCSGNGLRMHKYGPHIFHTNNEKVYKFINRFCELDNYRHKVKAEFNGEYFTLPPNKDLKKRFTTDEILDIFFKPYTKKMWNISWDKLSSSVKNRLKFRDDDSDEYFTDKYQGMPKEGYTKLVENMLNHENITLFLNSNIKNDCMGKHRIMWEYDHVFSAMPIDEFYNNRFSALEWRSVKFREVHYAEAPVEGVFVINNTTVLGATRTAYYTELSSNNSWWDKFIRGDRITWRASAIAEYPCDADMNNGERYYPVKDPDGYNTERYKKYVEYAKGDENVTHVGRCGKYTYIDMDQAINQGLQTAIKYIEKDKE